MSISGCFENPLLVTDGSQFSEGAVKEAIRIAKQCSGKMTALTVVEFNPEFAALAPDMENKMEVEAKEMIDRIKDRARDEGIECDSLVMTGENPHESIVEMAEKIKADIIVMGRRGRTGIKRLLMGSVTSRVIGHSPVKVLVVPKDA